MKASITRRAPKLALAVFLTFVPILSIILQAGPPPPPPPPPSEPVEDRITGGGWINGTPSGGFANFGVAGGIQNGELWGHLNYVDHDARIHVKSTAVTGYAADARDPEHCRIISYDCTINGAAGTATVVACDHGEPGAEDTFDIVLSTGYHAGGDLADDHRGGGNIQLHKK